MRRGLVACDLFTVEVLTLAGLQRYLVFFVIALQSRRLTIAGIHPQPYGAWMERMGAGPTKRQFSDSGKRWHGRRTTAVVSVTWSVAPFHHPLRWQTDRSR